jgi:hypothetical protein
MFWLAQEPSLISYTPVDDTTTGVLIVFSGFWLFVWFAIWILGVIGLWKVFSKAGQPGWGSIIPIYNLYLLLKICGRPAWWIILFFIPFVNIVIYLLVAIDLAKAFGKSELFGVVALWLFSIIGILMLGFGSDKYVGAAAKPAEPAA